jgi:solute carrier family 13 (sodium-dependent dicarboxylate transporter), member 2/3/5
MIRRHLASFLFLAGPLLFGLMLLISTPLDETQQRLAAVMLWVVSWWLHPTLPLSVTGLIGVSLTTLMGVATFPEALKGFSNPVIYLFMGGFFLARALHVEGLDVWIAQRCLAMKIIAGNPRRVLIALALITAMFSTILSNTATTAMFIPIALSIFTHLEINEEQPTFKLLMLIPYSATIGGIATPIGSPPNVIALGLMETMTGIRIGFLEWMLMMVPIMLVALAGLFLMFRQELLLMPAQGLKAVKLPPPLLPSQKRLLSLLSVTVSLWVVPGLIELALGGKHPFSLLLQQRLPEGMVAILLGSALFVVPGRNQKPLMSWSDAQMIDWGVLLLFGAAISLGGLMFSTGLAARVGASLPFEAMPYLVGLLLITGITLFSTEIVTNSATANLLIPLVITTAPFSANPLVAVLCVTLACSMAFMMPVGTPPNAIAFGTGKLRLEWMIRKGFWLNIICLLTIWGLGQFIFA